LNIQQKEHFAKGTLGTFPGVFTPSVLTILGIILFLRLGYVVGGAGLGRALVIIGLANIISVLTSFSLSAIATNLKVKGGGDYYLISRTLGLEFGGSIGIVLYLAQSVSIAFYCIGFGEAVSDMFLNASAALPQIIASLAAVFLFIFAWLGADWATRFQYVVMAALAAALASFFVGGLLKWDTSLLAQNWTAPSTRLDFWIMFAIFFPAVTGFTQGVSMSGELKDPGKSLPLGTFMAVGVSIVVYFGSAFVFAATLPRETLVTDYGAMKQIASMGVLIHVGVIAATLSSAMASFLGAPRILQSLSQDRIFPFLLPFAKGSGPTDNPRRGILLSTGIAFATIALGRLNLIAPLVSMFFLVSYGLLNYATYFEARSSSPSFRPRFRWFDHRLSLLGWIACLGVMLAIDLTAGLVAISVLFAVYQYLRRTAGPARWADSRRSYHLQKLREHLHAAASEPEHARYWRPIILALSEDSRTRGQILRFSSWLEGGSGLTTLVKVLEGEGAKMLKLKSEAEEELHKDISAQGVKAFSLVLTAPNLQAVIHDLIQTFGIGPIHANIMILNWHDPLSSGIMGLNKLKYARNLREAFRLGCNVIMLDSKEKEWPSLESLPAHERRIDVWWGGDATSRLMLLLAYLMTRNEEWDGAQIRVLAVEKEIRSDEFMDNLRKTIEETRIDAEPEVLNDLNPDIIVETSLETTLSFFPFRLKGGHLDQPFGGDLEAFLSRLPITALVLAAEDIDLDAEPEEGKAGELAAALDALVDAQKKARDAEKEASKAEEKLREMQETLTSETDEAFTSRIKSVLEAKDIAIKATRKAAKALAKVEDAERTAEALGMKPEKTGEKESKA
jgi:amino acid transporter